MTPATRAPVMTCVGRAELSEFQRQNALLGERWRTAFAGDIAMPGKNHFGLARRPRRPEERAVAARDA